MEFCNGFAGKEDLYIPYIWKQREDKEKAGKNQGIEGLEEIEALLYRLADGKYVVKDKENRYYSVKKETRRYNEKDIPVVEIEALKDSVPLKRSQIHYGVRGFCFPALGASYVHIDDVDTYRVNYHENLHMKIYRTDPNHPEWEIRMLEDWRLGEEKRR